MKTKLPEPVMVQDVIGILAAFRNSLVELNEDTFLELLMPAVMDNIENLNNECLKHIITIGESLECYEQCEFLMKTLRDRDRDIFKLIGVL